MTIENTTLYYACKNTGFTHNYIDAVGSKFTSREESDSLSTNTSRTPETNHFEKNVLCEF